MYELHDPSNLVYDLSLGFSTNEDPGQGPPQGNAFAGWVRTGTSGITANVLGRSNCDAYASGVRLTTARPWSSARTSATRG